MKLWDCIRGYHTPIRLTDGLRELEICEHCTKRLYWGRRRLDYEHRSRSSTGFFSALRAWWANLKGWRLLLIFLALSTSFCSYQFWRLLSHVDRITFK